MTKTFLPPRSIRSSAATIAERGIFKRDKNKTDFSKPPIVSEDVLRAREREERLHEVNQIRIKRQKEAAKVLGVFATKVEEGYKILGFGITVATEEEVKNVAIQNGRAFYKIGERQVNLK